MNPANFTVYIKKVVCFQPLGGLSVAGINPYKKLDGFEESSGLGTLPETLRATESEKILPAKHSKRSDKKWM